MKVEPKQLRDAPRCGAHARTTGAPCRAPRVRGRSKCRMHGCGRGSGGPFGSRNGAWKEGKYSQAGKELITGLHQMRRDGEALLAVSLDAHGLSRKIPKVLRRRTHIRRARAEAKKAKEQK